MTSTESLYAAILSLENPDEARRFFRDLLTEEEIAEFSMRWKVARLLDEGIPYVAIQAKTGVSSTTVARISRWLNSGRDGYRLVLDRLHHTRPSPEKRRI